MKLTKLYLSENQQWFPKLQASQLLLPFYDSHAQGRKELALGAKKGESYLVKNAGQRFFIQVEVASGICTVKNLLATDLFSQQKIVVWLEQAARALFAKEIRLDFSKSQGTFWSENLLAAGFQQNGQVFTKKITVKWGLAFGGGGSHGAYQIGVWQALRELELPIAVVSGTSVGALNGALFAQGDFEAAKELWQDLATAGVLQFPAAAEKTETLQALIAQIASLTSHALVHQGVSTAPLQKILKGLVSHEKMAAKQVDFSFVTTRLRGLKETVITYQETTQEEWLQWLLASASFFPAMAAQKIKGEAYIDGGYRNNLPVDLLYEKEVTDCLAVDVKGPGITKIVTKPAAVNQLALHSPWSLGSFLLFSPERSQDNLQLGYLETLKTFGRLQGYWYSFTLTSNFEEDWRKFYEKWQNWLGKENILPIDEMLKKLRKFYRKAVVWENCGLVFYELIGKLLAIDPTVVYNESEFKAALSRREAGAVHSELSLSEWLQKYYRENSPLAEEKQIFWAYQQLQEQGTAWCNELLTVYKLFPVQMMLAGFLLEINQTEEG